MQRTQPAAPRFPDIAPAALAHHLASLPDDALTLLTVAVDRRADRRRQDRARSIMTRALVHCMTATTKREA